MRSSEEYTIGNQTVLVRELVVQEVVDLMEGRMKTERDGGIDAVLAKHHVGSEILSACCEGLNLGALHAETATEIERLADKVAELNPFFVRLLDDLVGGQAQKISGAA